MLQEFLLQHKNLSVDRLYNLSIYRRFQILKSPISYLTVLGKLFSNSHPESIRYITTQNRVTLAKAKKYIQTGADPELYLGRRAHNRLLRQTYEKRNIRNLKGTSTIMCCR